MIFERTKSGQENRASFLGVDIVCYVEGGGGANSHSDDVIFWRYIFSALRPDLRVHFLAKGGKPELEKRANDIIDKDIKFAIVAMDSDFDELLMEKIPDPRVLYTYGYSWENDLFCSEMLRKVYTFKCKKKSAEENEIVALDQLLKDLEKGLSWPVRADFCALVSKSSVLPRSTPGRVILRSTETGFPIVRRDEVLKLLTMVNRNTRPRQLPRLPSIDQPLRYCAGKIYAYACHLLVCAFLFDNKHAAARSMTPSHFRDVAHLLFEQFLTAHSDDDVVIHYNKQVRVRTH